MDVRLRDVAERAAVSVKTVSNVVNGSPRVAPDTRSRVQQVIEELGYRPNLSARHLRQGRTGTIAFAVPDLNVPYFSELASSVIAEAKQRSVTVLIEDTGGDRAMESTIAQGFSSSLIDGVILSPLALRRADLARTGRVPLVLLGERDYAKAIDHVVIDNVAAAREATTHLLELGRNRIAVIGVDDQETGRQRVIGYREALAARGIPAEAELMPVTGGFTRAAGAEVMRRLLALPEPPDAVFCFNDLLALGAQRVLLASGRRVPGDVAIVGFDDIEDGRYATPSLTTVAPDKTQIARLAVTLLLDRIETAEPGRQPVLAQAGHELVIRESTSANRTKE
ncbi:LacI family DNA-binding transcriptional regulator [Sciscionella marina]|uniref:LacI family DNA-binding transcriptional regulator n=1 Tax=Sciscionella marina TaxID=508770 RepID=UPI00037D822D|nr:LacI family DNA-binding transcriptional regulator [Sciscionella marina]